ncbi:uncharacterized protein LOC127723463 isoform X2 [Mytilus californianus]|uniref:uncharacterized protein LOC127723463 isoform X2 n=1 Tax=Mytilus californianus TaxID=6549 RepID=UPI0022480DE3|nr:uncharacterized protein LOC127723463 isoform X2 [Mytilus californianus]
MIFLLILIIGTATGYDLKCPAKAEWRLRAHVSCYSEDKYVCLFNLLEEKYMENCLGSDQSSIGSKLVFQPLFNLAECNAERFQPFVFTTHGHSECIFRKSKCVEEGQVIFNNGSSSNDVACRCDYTKGYAFVTRPKNICFCIPFEEDCSCLRVTCTKLSSDYQCITNEEILVNATCQEILPSISHNTVNNTVQLIESNRKSYTNAHHVAYIIIVIIAVYLVIAVIVLLKFCVFVPPRILLQEMIKSDGRNIGLKCYVNSHLPLTSVRWCREPGGSIFTDIKSYNGFSRNGLRILTHETREKDDFATYKCIASNKIGTVESDPVQLNDEERQKFIQELFLKGECGKLHFARLVFVGKNGVGKTSLMRRLLWKEKEDVTLTQSTDGIEVEKCNINIANGKWSPCNKIDDDLTRLIHQVYKDKILNVERATAETVIDQEPFSSDTDESKSVSDKELSKSSDDSDYIDDLNDDTDSDSTESDDTARKGIIRPDIHSVISDNKDNYVTVEVDLKLENVNDRKINSYPSGNLSDPVNDENINEMTSTIMKSYLESTKEEQDDMLAFCWLWDFAGQKDFYATHQVFLSKCAVYLLVTDSLEFSTVENQGLDFEGSAQYVSFWFDAIHCYWSTTEKGRLDPPIIVVCTNEDQIKEPLEREKRQRQFKDNLGQVLKDQKKKEHLRNIYFISNTEDNDSVFEEIRKEISRQVMDMQDWGKNCPLKWLLFQQVLLKLKDSNVPISSIKTLLKVAKHEDIGISEENEVKRCLQFCNDNGTVIYFDEENLADHVILDPKWLINAFRCLVSDKINNVIEVSDDWQKLKDTGQLTDSLISRLFKKEPKLKFEDNKAHLIEVMKRFDIIVNLKDSTELYMPCMIKSCSFSEVQNQFYDGSPSFYKTSWLCLEFKFLPPAFFNHIIAWYIKQYNVSVIIDKENRSRRNALYRQVGVFDLDASCCEQLVVCEGTNTIALQVWDSRMSNKTYGDLASALFRFVKTLRTRYSLHISYTTTFTCKDGDFTINRKTIEDLVTKVYRCAEHRINHTSDDLVKPWKFSRKLEFQRALK